ncbi:hypothetical protein H1P_580007 [Hyella patelloides LEGE 07179]|uniref:Uncharacterized protein n=1 Tax=Hyella patelloides LEGE 07179 TaxID=945734 RepID=A0A563W0S2_9CYAN|nr:hypothetical protein H1P_580007 [Hyella patelloides LEGE 07179]
MIVENTRQLKPVIILSSSKNVTDTIWIVLIRYFYDCNFLSNIM